MSALGSLLAQIFPDFEVICINDGSTDGSRAIIQRYSDADPRFRVSSTSRTLAYGAFDEPRPSTAPRAPTSPSSESDDFWRARTPWSFW
ncbi:MAG: glycosyltransferase family 2 protein [Collinsella sp.]